jgi:hypothetical protein
MTPIPPSGMAIAALTVMLWILWSDSVRRRGRRPPVVLYGMRIVLYLLMSGVLIFNLVRYPELFSGGSRALVLVTATVGVLGAGYFGRKLATRS